MSPAQSPYEAALGDAAFGAGGLHPRLRAYFSAIPEGMRGVGEGVFATVGTPRAWLRPLIRLFADPDVLFPVWARDVPFSVVNLPAAEDGRPAVTGERTFHLPDGDRVMRDLILAAPEGLVDILGSRRSLRALFAAEILDGALRLASSRVSLRIGRRWLRIPGPLAPHVELVERFSEEDDRQHVEVALSLPLVGRVYEYAGSFRYELRAG